MLSGKLYLIPIPIADYDDAKSVIPKIATQALFESSTLFVEHPKTIRRLLKSLETDIDIDSFSWVEVGKRSEEEEIDDALIQVSQGERAALVSESGMPCIGDPGFKVVQKAHQMGIRVIPLPGPNSFLMALMASGFSGQSFSFHGYVPLKNPLRARKISDWEQRAKQSGVSQIFMETPYRNNQLLKDLMDNCSNSSMLSISCDLMGPEEQIITASIKDWKAMKIELPKQPAVFILGKQMV